MSFKKDIASLRRMQDDYALSERRYERSKARGKRSRKSAGRRAPSTSSAKNEGRVEGFLAGTFVTALAWLVKGSK